MSLCLYRLPNIGSYYGPVHLHMLVSKISLSLNSSFFDFSTYPLFVFKDSHLLAYKYDLLFACTEPFLFFDSLLVDA